MSANRAAWAWILSNIDLIERISSRFARTRGLDVDDFRSEVVVRLVERHHLYNPRASSPSTWVWWSSREVATRLGRARDRYLPSETVEDDRSVDDAGFEEVERASTIHALLATCSPPQREAVVSVLDDLSREEVVERLGVSVETRNARLYRIGRSVSRELAGGAA